MVSSHLNKLSLSVIEQDVLKWNLKCKQRRKTPKPWEGIIARHVPIMERIFLAQTNGVEASMRNPRERRQSPRPVSYAMKMGNSTIGNTWGKEHRKMTIWGPSSPILNPLPCGVRQLRVWPWRTWGACSPLGRRPACRFRSTPTSRIGTRKRGSFRKVGGPRRTRSSTLPRATTLCTRRTWRRCRRENKRPQSTWSDAQGSDVRGSGRRRTRRRLR